MVTEDIIASQAAATATANKILVLMPEQLKQRENVLMLMFLNHRGNPLTKLQALYGFMDELYSFISQFVPCKKGCNHCCHIPVSISDLEIEFIKKQAKVRRTKSPLPLVDSPCPFLVKGACSIYKVRPFFCRQHVSLDATPMCCRVENANKIMLQRLHFTEVRKVYEMLLSKSGLGQIRDIREYSRR